MQRFNLFSASQVHAPGCDCDECSELLLIDAIRDVSRGIARYVHGDDT